MRIKQSEARAIFYLICVTCKVTIGIKVLLQSNVNASFTSMTINGYKVYNTVPTVLDV